jgi:hypothetical protein
VQLQRQPPIRMRQKPTTLRLPQMTTLHLRMIMLLPSQLQRMMITRLPMQIHLQHLSLHLHRLPPKHCLLTRVMALYLYPLLALQLKNVIYR